MDAADASRISLAGVLGTAPAGLREQLGEPVADRSVGEQRWMVFELEGLGSLRCRCSPVLGTWTLSFSPPLPPSLQAAARRVGLWPQLGPDALPPDSGESLVRRDLTDREGPAGVDASATALLAPAGVVRLAAFDEAPEW